MFINKTRKYFLTVTTIVFLLAACRGRNASNPTDHLSAKMMQQVLQDISIAETYSAMVKDSVYKGGTKNLDSLSAYYKDIFNHHRITQAQFSESMAWYKGHPDELDSVCNKIMLAVTKRQNAPHP